MIDIVIIIGIALVALAPLLLYCKTDNTKWLQFKAVAEKRLTRYEDDDKEIVEMLVRRFGELCIQIAACPSLWDSKRGLILANEATRITMQLKKRGFMKKTKLRVEGNSLQPEGCEDTSPSTRKETTH